jgi:hypothetical protein
MWEVSQAVDTSHIFNTCQAIPDESIFIRQIKKWFYGIIIFGDTNMIIPMILQPEYFSKISKAVPFTLRNVPK